jgi:hypothetical protein
MESEARMDDGISVLLWPFWDLPASSAFIKSAGRFAEDSRSMNLLNTILSAASVPATSFAGDYFASACIAALVSGSNSLSQEYLTGFRRARCQTIGHRVENDFESRTPTTATPDCSS